VPAPVHDREAREKRLERRARKFRISQVSDRSWVHNGLRRELAWLPVARGAPLAPTGRRVEILTAPAETEISDGMTDFDGQATALSSATV
jgi:hypothetical protein